MAYRSFSLIPTWSNNLLSDRFTQIDNLFSRLTGESPVGDVPAYNLLQKDKEHYEMTVSVPGYTQNELDISVLNNHFTLRGIPKSEEITSTEEKDSMTYLHKGIQKKEFSLSFSLEHRIMIYQAKLDNGLLTLQFTYDIPEQEKPKKISIGSNNNNKDGHTIEHNKT
ncbi:Putative heat shock protein (plasmid) [Candidatus Erwinia haradaeae]|uniref:Heat shock protein n=1 Tax=Candidatus Erwinia haradaeae TaxID=1922217 RepID=A0A451D322_9GAMM|nr:Hsp20 family protein [Candidatus Erwinia haradaeae]VFP80047.1 Putative heat shock protein [Candidatus Erwinia haradaeae]VFP80071.1 Putative heat shock protein [Candidatus Erwinia haradaeae]